MITRLRMLVLAFAALAAACSSSPGPAYALVDCERAVRERLSSPAGAAFNPDGLLGVQDVGSGRYRVRSWVAAPNSNGVQIRRPWVCVVSYAGDAEHPTVEAVTGV